jgi:hypothetical protein
MKNHRVRDVAMTHQTAEAIAHVAEPDAASRKLAHASATDVAAPYYEVKMFHPNQLKHFWQGALVVLHVRIHYGDIWRRTRQYAFNTGGRETAAADSFDDPNPVMGRG